MKLTKVDLRITRRDLIVLVVLVAAAIGFGFWQLILNPLINRTDEKREQLIVKEQELMVQEAKLRRLEELRAQPDIIMREINVITDKYLPDNDVQFYYDLLNNLAFEAGLKPQSVRTRLITSGDVSDAQTGRSQQETAIIAAINEYDTAIADVNPTEETVPGGPSQRMRHSFKYLPITYEVVEGTFESIQTFIQSINDLTFDNGKKYTMYFSNASIESMNSGDLRGVFDVNFVSIDRLSVLPVVLPDDLIYEPDERLAPAELPDVFNYRRLNEFDVSEVWVRQQNDLLNRTEPPYRRTNR